MSLVPATLLARTTCPHCWTTFSPEDVLWISAHADLLGDPRLGPEQQQRFLPTRFNADGQALDARGFVCQSLACPHCHLGLPRALLEIEPTFVSILGTPACGKSFFLAAMTWQLRRDLPQSFAVSFSDGDPVANRTLNEYEESLFLNPHAEEWVPLADLIRKTELQGELYDVVQYGNQSVSYPRPFLFVVQPKDNHPQSEAAGELSRVLCLYDNAGEHFQPGQDTTSSPVTRHMAQARALLFLFDPTQDVRFQKLCQTRQLKMPAAAGRTSRQEAVLQEAITRVRRVLGLPQSIRHDRPLIVVLTKADAWAGLLPKTGIAEPWAARDGMAGLDVEQIERRSREARALMVQTCPELVATAEGFAQEVLYVPVSALGQSPGRVLPGQGPAIRPCDIRPTWVTVPLLYSLSRWTPGLLPTVRRSARTTGPMPRPGRAGLAK